MVLYITFDFKNTMLLKMYFLRIVKKGKLFASSMHEYINNNVFYLYDMVMMPVDNTTGKLR